MRSIDILGVPVPDDRPIFLIALAVHVVSGSVGVIAGALASSARKRPGRHPTAGKVYFASLVGVFLTATAMAAMRWHHNWHLFVIASTALSLGVLGLLARRRAWPRWMVWHGTAMGGSYIALFTGFYVDNGPQLPLWNRLPDFAFWVLPAAVGIPLIAWALRRNGAVGRTRHRRADRSPAVPRA
jgi:hypothetical protein